MRAVVLHHKIKKTTETVKQYTDQSMGLKIESYIVPREMVSSISEEVVINVSVCVHGHIYALNKSISYELEHLNESNCNSFLYMFLNNMLEEIQEKVFKLRAMKKILQEIL